MLNKEAYLKFLEGKIDNGGNDAAIEFDFSAIHPSTFPHQRDAIKWALHQQCALIAMSFGLGKTQIETEIAPPARQWIHRSKVPAHLPAWCTASVY